MQYKNVKEMSLFSITWPLILTFSLNMMMPVVDSFFLSRVSDMAAGAVGALFSVLMVVFIATIFFTQAGVSVATQYMGGDSYCRANAANIVTLLLGLLMSALISLLLYRLREDVGLWLGLSEEGNRFAPNTSLSTVRSFY